MISRTIPTKTDNALLRPSSSRRFCTALPSRRSNGRVSYYTVGFSAFPHQRHPAPSVGCGWIYWPLHSHPKLPHHLPMQAYQRRLGPQHQSRMHQSRCHVHRYSIFECNNRRHYLESTVAAGLAIKSAETSKAASMWDPSARKLVS